MHYPKLFPPETYRETVDIFRGYNRRLRVGDGEFADMENLSSDHFPVLGVRPVRGLYAEPADAQGLIAKDALCYVDGTKFVINGYPVEMHLSVREADCPKKLVSMGPYVIIFPDKKYINTIDVTDFGNLEARFESSAQVQLSPCDMDGNDRAPDFLQPEAPPEPGNMQLWMDTSSQPHALKQWSAAGAMWTDLDAVYVKIACPGIGNAFRPYDAVTLSGLGEALDGSAVLWAVGDDYIVISGLIDSSETLGGTLTVSRTVPEMDYVIESGNRLWGCRYGIGEDGQIVNEIYASKLGDFRNWRVYMGLSSDSYAVSLGSDGPFTGAVAHMGYPIFFKENCLHKIYGQMPANFCLQTTPCRGVQQGSHESLAIVGETLLYKSTLGVCAYDGSLPTDISSDLGSMRYRNAVAGSIGEKYYICMEHDGVWSLFVYDMAKALWHREDDLQIRKFCSCREVLYALEAGSGRILSLTGSDVPPAEAPVHWMAQTGMIDGFTTDAKYLTRISVRMCISAGAHVELAVRYNSAGPWETVGLLRGGSTRSFTVPILPRRCDHLQLQFRGVGDARIYAITKTLEQGSDCFDN